MEYTEAKFLTADTRPTDIKPSKETISKNPVVLFHNYSSIAHKTFMELHDKNLIRDFHNNKQQLEHYKKLDKEAHDKFEKMSILEKFFNLIGIIKINPTIYKNQIKTLEDENVKIAQEYKHIMSNLVQPNEKLTLKTHALHYYMTEIPIINRKTQDTCDDMFSKNQFLTLNIEDTTAEPYFLFFHNWIMAPVLQSYADREALHINEAIEQL